MRCIAGCLGVWSFEDPVQRRLSRSDSDGHVGRGGFRIGEGDEN